MLVPPQLPLESFPQVALFALVDHHCDKYCEQSRRRIDHIATRLFATTKGVHNKTRQENESHFIDQ